MGPKESFDAKPAIVQVYVELFKRRAEVEGQSRLAYWTALIAGAFLPQPPPLKPYPYIGAAGALLLLLAAFSTWLFMLLHANQKDQRQLFHFLDEAVKELPPGTSAPTVGKKRGVVHWGFFAGQVLISVVLSYVTLSILQIRGVLTH